MDYVTPKVLILDAITLAKGKAALPVRDLLIRGILAGVFLSYATSLAFVAMAQGALPIVGAALFPCGFVILVLLGLELGTGNFAFLPLGVAAGEVRWRELARNWFWVYAGNLIGGLIYAVLFYAAITNVGTSDGGALANLVREAAKKKTLLYMAAGGRGWAAAFIKGILCNWMVAIGAVLALSSRSTIGKVVAMWLPIMTFFAQGYEHSIVNMFLIPAGMILGAPVSISQWWMWNQVPVTLGNIVSGALLTGVALHVTHGTAAPVRQTVEEAGPSLVADEEPAWAADAQVQ
jgi:formate transporter